MGRGALAAAVVLILAGGWAWAGEPASPMFPFVLPWDDASPGVTDLSGWPPTPAGKLGPVRAGDDGHLYAGDRRIRFLGVNLCFGGCFPSRDDADKVAARMAKFGINVVRFHHMDMLAFPGGIRARKGDATGELDPEALERLDYFISRLQKHGIYANLNLLVSRPFNKADGLPAEIERVDWKERHVVGFFHEPARKPQQDYARTLLAHRNPYTKLTYAEDPGVAFVEINNENGLVHSWLGGQVDRLPDVFLRDLQRQWNAWLRRRHGTTARLRQAWGVKEEAPGKELLANADFACRTEGWVLERHETAEADVTADEAVPAALRAAAPPLSARVTVTRASAEGWHVQFNQRGMKVQAERPYTLTFWAKADKPLTMLVELGQGHDPWNNLGLSREVKLTGEWQSFRFTFLPAESEDNARVNFSNLARQAATVWLAGLSFRPGGAVGLAEGERLEDGSLRCVEHARLGEYTAEGQRDWLRFLWETEDDYWQAMQRYLKEELRVRGVVVGTIVGCSTPNLMARLGAVDTHAYWQHPHFPGRPWDPDDWVVANKSMVNEAGGTLPGLALRRVLGKPHCVSEYNHAAPNTYGSEGFLLLAAYGALQDWDAVYAFSYSHNADWDARRIPSFFDIGQHPTKMATLPAAAALFVRGDVRPAREQVVAALSKDKEIDLLRTARAWDLVHAGQLGVPKEAALLHRVALAAEGGKAAKERGEEVPRPAEPRYASDTGELLWDLSTKGRGVVTVNTAKSKAVIGYGGGQRFDLGGVVIEPGATSQDGWGVVTLTAMEGDFKGPGRLLVTATGSAENTGMKWKSAAKDSVGRNWGKAPSLVEGVPARITLPVPAAGVGAWALDERGQRRAALAVEASGGRAVIAFGPEQQTLWYEIELK
jgi:Carbohydrate binding domain